MYGDSTVDRLAGRLHLGQITLRLFENTSALMVL
jgi:hypothetical protein